jgi:hypothetical protein
MRSATVVAVLVGCLFASKSVAQDKAPPTRGRPIVIFIHGRDQPADAERTIWDAWAGAFVRGLDGLPPDVHGLIDSARGKDVDFVWYENIVKTGASSRPDPSSPCQFAGARYAPIAASPNPAPMPVSLAGGPHEPKKPAVLSDVFLPGTGRDTTKWLPAWTSERTDSLIHYVDGRTRGTDLGALALNGDIAGGTARMSIDFIARVPGVATRIASSSLRDTYTFLADGNKRCEARRRLLEKLDAARLEERPVILVAHSMGTIVSFDVLNGRVSSNERYDVIRFVTMGSQLGLETVMGALAGGFQRDSVPVPASILSWINFRNRSDYLGFHMRDRFRPVVNAFELDSIDGGKVVRRMPMEARIFTPNRRCWDTPEAEGCDMQNQSRHSALLYLRSKEVIAAITQAWCDGLERPAYKANMSDHERSACATVRGEHVFRAYDYAWCDGANDIRWTIARTQLAVFAAPPVYQGVTHRRGWAIATAAAAGVYYGYRVAAYFIPGLARSHDCKP